LFTLSFGEEDWFGYSSGGGFVGESFHGYGLRVGDSDIAWLIAGGERD
jgi:hypothetical protein